MLRFSIGQCNVTIQKVKEGGYYYRITSLLTSVVEDGYSGWDELQKRVESLDRRENKTERKDEVVKLKGELDEMRLNIDRKDGVVGIMKIVGCLVMSYFIAGIIKRA